MFLRSSNETRPYHLGPHPQEILPRDITIRTRENNVAQNRHDVKAVASDSAFGKALVKYRTLFDTLSDGPVAPERAPVPRDPTRRTIDIKGGGYFLNASLIGICRMPSSAWLAETDHSSHAYAIVICVEHGREPEADNLAAGWVNGCAQAASDLRATEIACCLAGHIRLMGFAARAHSTKQSQLDVERLAVLSGIAVRRPGGLHNPFFADRFSIAVVSTEYKLEEDLPLADDVDAVQGLHYWLGINGAQSGRERARRAKRSSHLSAYPMEEVKRIDRPTTLIIDDEVPRVPKRAAFFARAAAGDLGDKTKRERQRFATKHPFALGMIPLIRNMVPFQDGQVADKVEPSLDDPVTNAQAIKSLSYMLGADLTGICEIPRYAWYSHREDGNPLEPYHKYAVVMLIDQEYETMEGASGDDWISGAQSMRGYMRGAEVAGIIADTLRNMGHSARPQTNSDSDLLHIPLVLWAGLGELSRIGELVLNPFVGPRFKSVVLTTNLPLEVDKPIDFGLQYFCNNCLKCARECPCDAISQGDKVMFNGYEMWKPDVERCTRYRVTNPKGSACGRCMKTCPLNKVVSADGPLLTRAASWMGVNAMWTKPALVPLAVGLDDMLGHGKRNPHKKWWFDLEIVDGVCVTPKGTNERDIEPARERKMDPNDQKIAYYHADMMPEGDADTPVPVNRKQALSAASFIETPEEALRRKRRSGKTPDHYIAREGSTSAI
ncbi:MAG: Fe-S protein [Hyphomicrobiaceae bacterium]